MSSLSVTLIDVGWGDSILLTWEDGGDFRFGLIDSNDTTYLQSSYVFLKRSFEKLGVDTEDKPVFDFVMLSHAHADHGQGLKNVMRQFGTKHFWYPKSTEAGSLANLIRYANRSTNVRHHQSIDDTKVLPALGGATLEVLWPRRGRIDEHENNNSIVLAVTYGDATILLTGDAEGEVWEQVASDIPDTTRVFKVPHHGSVNGTFLDGRTPWLEECPGEARLAISSHVRPFSHPHDRVVDEFDDRGFTCYRTDEHYHVTFTAEGGDVVVKYSHV